MLTYSTFSSPDSLPACSRFAYWLLETILFSFPFIVGGILLDSLVRNFYLGFFSACGLFAALSFLLVIFLWLGCNLRRAHVVAPDHGDLDFANAKVNFHVETPLDNLWKGDRTEKIIPCGIAGSLAVPLGADRRQETVRQNASVRRRRSNSRSVRALLQLLADGTCLSNYGP